MRFVWIFLAAVWAVAVAFGGDPLAQPALNPVTALPAPAHPPVALVEGGVPRFVLVWDRAAERGAPAGLENQPIREAVRTLRREIGFCTGAEVDVADAGADTGGNPAAPRPVILVGRSARTDALGIDPASLPPEGFVVTTFSNGVAIVGNDSSLAPGTAPDGPRRATLWGALDFLERFFGCRYYYPGPDGCVRPVCTNLVLAPCAYTDAPRFRNRGDGFRPDVATVARTLGTPLVRASLSDWRAAARLAHTTSFTAIHSPDPRMWAEAHPEWMGTSFLCRPDGGFYYCPTNHMRNYYDVTNLEFADALVEGLARDDTPEGRRRQGFAHNDARTVVFAQCDSFRTLEEMRANPVVQREGLITDANVALGPYGYFSDVYGRFYRHFVMRLNARLPGRRLILMPYAGCTYAPTQERFRHLPDNVELCVCLPKVPRFIRNPQVRDLMVRELPLDRGDRRTPCPADLDVQRLQQPVRAGRRERISAGDDRGVRFGPRRHGAHRGARPLPRAGARAMRAVPLLLRDVLRVPRAVGRGAFQPGSGARRALGAVLWRGGRCALVQAPSHPQGGVSCRDRAGDEGALALSRRDARPHRGGACRHAAHSRARQVRPCLAAFPPDGASA